MSSFTQEVYNQDGYDKDGYDRQGFDKDGYDREGYDKKGYNRDGYNRMGRDALGYDYQGNSFDGFDNTSSDAYGVNRYDRRGYDRKGYDHAGYDRHGYDKSGYNREGYNKLGYNREGYNKAGYDRLGYNREGIDKDGYNREGYDKEGYDREGFDKENYNREGFDKNGYDREHYDKEGYNCAGYDREGYDREGFDKKGYDRKGYDKEGYDREGFDKKGYDRAGYDREGYDREGYNKRGVDSAGYRRDGFDNDGYDRRGFNRDEMQRGGQRYDKDGYDFYGFDKDGFNRRGLNLYGYNKAGYTLDGYDKNGFNIWGFNREGFYKGGGRYDEQGFSADGLRRDGHNRFDIEGYDDNGIDKEGYNREGYDKEGYDREGFDEEGYNREGYNREGYNHEGYDANGFNQNHICISGEYDNNGYDYLGYDKEGYNERGFNKEKIHRFGWKYDAKGYNAYGYSSSGYDAKGYNRLGNDSNGYDKNGYKDGKYNYLGWTADRNYRGGGRYDANGFDIDGFDRQGLNAEGIGRDGYDIFGFNKDGMNYIGCDLYGSNIFGEVLVDVDEEGINLYTGCDEDGYYRSGYNANGFDKEGYNREGYDQNGYNKQGYNRRGYNKAGYDVDGYDADGFNIFGFDHRGYDKDGYNSRGYDEDGFDRKGYAANGFNRAGYDINGYDISGYDENGYDKDGYDKNGYDKKGVNKDGTSLEDLKKSQQAIQPVLRIGMRFTHPKCGRGEIIGFECDKRIVKVDFDDFDSLRHISEKEVTSCMVSGNVNNMKERMLSYDGNDDKTEREFFKLVMDYIEKMEAPVTRRKAEAKNTLRKIATFEGDEVVYSYEEKYDSTLLYNDMMAEVKQSPYFCHIDYKENHNLYIGKKGYPKYIVDWADPRASYYYQYNIYIENPEIELSLVRDIDIENGYYFGYRDKYNKNRPIRNFQNISQDGHLARIIEANQEDKRIHDIIQTIQNNQYDIITSDSSKNVMVLGCAGSGKTMILLHKIRYMKYNESSLDMKKIVVISPTDLLGKESKELSRILQVSDVRQYTMEKLLFLICELVSKENDVKLNYVLDDSFSAANMSFGDIKERHSVASVISPFSKDNQEFIALEKRKLNDRIEKQKRSYVGTVTVEQAYEFYPGVKAEVNKYSRLYVETVINRGKRICKDLPGIEKQIVFYEWLLAKDCFSMLGKEETVILYSKQIAMCLDMKNLYRGFGNKKFAGHLDILHAVTCFCEGELKQEVLEGVLKEWKNISAVGMEKEICRLKGLRDRIKELSPKLYILETLYEEGVFKETHETAYSIRDNEVYECAYEIGKLYEFIAWKSSDECPLHILEQYDLLLDRERRLNSYLESRKCNIYMEEILNYCYGLNPSDVDGVIHLGKSHVYRICKDLCTLFKYRNNSKHIFIDEFQDFTADILLFLKKIYPSAVFHLFGDFRQCINDSGMTEERKGTLSCFDFKTYQIMENYRNAKGITEYVNWRFGLNMLAVGLKGDVVVSEKISLQALEKGDRAAIIVANEELAMIVYEMLKESSGDISVFNFCETKEISRDGYNVLPVLMAKGLEFESVISVEYKMTENQKYVSATRAIRYLQVVQSDIA